MREASTVSVDPKASSPSEQIPSPDTATPPVRKDANLHTKVGLLIALAAVLGNLIGVVEGGLGYMAWPMLVGLAALVTVLLRLSKHWICGPVDRLLKLLDRLEREDRPASFKALPVDRTDEVGRIARVVSRLSVQRVQDYHEAKRLRRNLDHGVEQATRRATVQLRQMAMQDTLTRLGNRRFLDENLEQLFQSAWVSGTELTCVAIDMDNFKTVNDTLGHDVGDDLLRTLGSLIRASTRSEDCGVRLGGDEFVVLLPGCGMDRAKEFAQQLVALFRQHVRTAMPSEVRTGLSMGISELKSGITSGAQLLKAADDNLYVAKRSGKGQLAFA